MMKTKPLIFVFFLCPLIIISAIAIDSSKGTSECVRINIYLFPQLLYSFIILINVIVWFVVGETENSKNKIGVERVGDHGGGNVDDLLGSFANWVIKDVFFGGGNHREARRSRRGRNRGNWGGGNEYSSVRGGYEGRGGVHEENLERGENEEPGLGWGKRRSKIRRKLIFPLHTILKNTMKLRI